MGDISYLIETCIEHTGIWTNNNMLKLNKDNAEFIVFLSKQHMKNTYNLFIKVVSS